MTMGFPLSYKWNVSAVNSDRVTLKVQDRDKHVQPGLAAASRVVLLGSTWVSTTLRNLVPLF